MPDLIVSTDKARLDIHAIHAYLTKSYWAEGRTLEAVKKSIDHSICFGVYLDKKQVGFARVVSDYSIFAYIMDVFILEEHRGKSYGKKLMNAIMHYEDLTDVENWLLRTLDAHGLYQQLNFEELAFPERTMIRKR